MRNKRIMIIGVAVSFIIAGLLWYFLSSSDTIEKYRSMDTETVATIIAVNEKRVSGNNRQYYTYSYTYSYDTDTGKYTGKTDYIKAKYSKGDAMECWYDSSNPEESVLGHDRSLADAAFIGVFALIIVMFVIVFLVYGRALRILGKHK